MPKKKKPSMTLALPELPELPEDIQRRIILSLPPKAFGRSSVLSKSWLSFYNSTRYSFDFSLLPQELQCIYHFCLLYNTNRSPEELSQEIMNFDQSFSASLLREKLTVDKFNINMELSRYNLDTSQHYSEDELADLVYKWLAALFTTNNIVKELSIRIETSQAISKFYMPPEILSNESLQVLHLGYDSISHRSQQVLHLEYDSILDGVYPINLGCLKILSLLNVSIDGKSMERLLTACPILEELTLWTELRGKHIIIKGLHKLKDLDISGFEDVRIQEAPALEDVWLSEDKIEDRTIINSQLCRRIKHLNMYVCSERTATHIQKIISCLPALEDLTLNMSMDCGTDIKISSPCLENLKLYISEFNHDLKIVNINAPNLSYYEYETEWPTFCRHLMTKTGMLQLVVIELTIREIEEPRHVLELRKALQMIEQLKLGVQLNLGVDSINFVNPRVCVEASRSDQKNVSATRVIEMLDAGAVKFDADGNFCV